MGHHNSSCSSKLNEQVMIEEKKGLHAIFTLDENLYDWYDPSHVAKVVCPAYWIMHCKQLVLDRLLKVD